MATVEHAVRYQSKTRSARIVGFITRSPLHLVLVGVAVIWLVPTLGLAVTSFRAEPDIASSGWWHGITHWSWTLSNYSSVIHGQNMGRAFVNSLIITLPATLLPLTIGALAAYGFAWGSFPFRDTAFLFVVALIMVPIQ